MTAVFSRLLLLSGHSTADDGLVSKKLWKLVSDWMF